MTNIIYIFIYINIIFVIINKSYIKCYYYVKKKKKKKKLMNKKDSLFSGVDILLL